jgi:hypothetical protein
MMDDRICVELSSNDERSAFTRVLEGFPKVTYDSEGGSGGSLIIFLDPPHAEEFLSAYGDRREADTKKFREAAYRKVRSWPFVPRLA